MQPISLRSLLPVLLVAAGLALLLAKPYAASWNDGSRLATVESFVDYHTLYIDQSIFTRPTSPYQPSPYPRDDALLNTYGTLDKMYIDGHYYSDKSPIPALLMGGVYGVWKGIGGPAAAERPDRFCWIMTVASSGLAYVVAAACLFIICLRLGLSQFWSLALTVAFGAGTVSIAYVQHVNNHMLLLAVAMAQWMLLLQPATLTRTGIAGCLAGLAYAIDLGAGPALLAITGLFVLYEARSARRPVFFETSVFFLSAFPWLLAHHFLNFQIGGTFGPANAVPEYFNWPGSPFRADNMTGSWNHASIGAAFTYALDMLFGKRGFLPHNLPLFLLLPLLPILLRTHFREKPIVVAGLAWMAVTWLLYAATSRNMSGVCVSVRWLVPLLAPAFVMLAICLRDLPRHRVDFLILAGGGVLLGAGMAVKGPWSGRILPFYWLIYGGTLAIWGGFWWIRHLQTRSPGVGSIYIWRFWVGRWRRPTTQQAQNVSAAAKDSSTANE
jgi:hypothetical protein